MTVTQRGSATYKTFGAIYPIAAPTGLAVNDVVLIIIEHDNDAAISLAGFSTLIEWSGGGKTILILQGIIAGSPPSGFSPVNGDTTDTATCVAFSGVDLANQVVGTPLSDGTFQISPEIPEVIVIDDNSFLIAVFVDNASINPAIAELSAIGNNGYQTIRGNLVSAGATGNLVVGPLANQFTYHLGVALSLPPTLVPPPSPAGPELGIASRDAWLPKSQQ